MLFIFVLTGTAFVPFFVKEFTISLLKSIKTFSTIDMTFSSVTLSPLINLVFIFSFFEYLFAKKTDPTISGAAKAA